MSNVTTTPTPPKAKAKGPMAIAFEKINKLQEDLKELKGKPHECKMATLAVTAETRQYTGRVTLPNFGQALPEGVGYHQYVSVRLRDQLIAGSPVPPTESYVMGLLRDQALEEWPGHVIVELSDISVLPAGWGEESEE